MYAASSGVYFGAAATMLVLSGTQLGKEYAIAHNGFHLANAEGVKCAKEGVDCFKTPNHGAVALGLDYESFINGAVFVSVVLQFIFSLIFSAMADYGNLRKLSLTVFNTLGALGLMVPIFFGINPDLYWLAGIVIVWTSLHYNMAYIYFNAYLPILTKNHYSVHFLTTEVVEDAEKGGEDSIAIATSESERMHEDLQHRISAQGDILLTGTMLAGQVVCSSYLFYAGKDAEAFATQVCLFALGVVSLCISLPGVVRLKTRPGPPVPPGMSYTQLTVMRVRGLFATYEDLPQTFLFLLAFAFLSDGVTTVNSAWNVYAVSQLNLSVTESLVGFNAYCVMAIVSDFIFYFLIKYDLLNGKNTLLYSLAVCGSVPLYVLLFGVSSKTGFVMISGLFGFVSCPFWTFGRSTFAQLVPAGQEAGFFALYQITSGGTAWMGPLMLVIVQEMTNSYIIAFGSLTSFFILGVILLSMLETEKGRADTLRFEERCRNAAATAAASSKKLLL